MDVPVCRVNEHLRDLLHGRRHLSVPATDGLAPLHPIAYGELHSRADWGNR
jgi:hypothetical protein